MEEIKAKGGKMRKIIMCKGIPASGKSTWAKAQVEMNPGQYKRVNKDDLREMIDSGRHSRGNEKMVLDARDFLIKRALDAGHSVIVDDTNFHPKHKERFEEIASEYDGKVKVEEKFFDVSLEEALKRNKQRNKPVPDKAIRQMYREYISHNKTDKYVPRINHKMLTPAIICDIDGTLAHMKDRSPYDWNRVGEDIVDEEIRDLINALQGVYHVILVTGRDGCCLEETIEWLDKHDILYDDIYIRPAGDQRADWIVKKEIYDEHIKDQFFVHFVIDDRPQVCRMWYKLGIKLFKVGDPDAEDF